MAAKIYGNDIDENISEVMYIYGACARQDTISQIGHKKQSSFARFIEGETTKTNLEISPDIFENIDKAMVLLKNSHNVRRRLIFRVLFACFVKNKSCRQCENILKLSRSKVAELRASGLDLICHELEKYQTDTLDNCPDKS